MYIYRKASHSVSYSSTRSELTKNGAHGPRCVHSNANAPMQHLRTLLLADTCICDPGSAPCRRGSCKKGQATDQLAAARLHPVTTRSFARCYDTEALVYVYSYSATPQRKQCPEEELAQSPTMNTPHNATTYHQVHCEVNVFEFSHNIRKELQLLDSQSPLLPQLIVSLHIKTHRGTRTCKTKCEHPVTETSRRQLFSRNGALRLLEHQNSAKAEHCLRRSHCSTRTAQRQSTVPRPHLSYLK